jgi:hypothetical protein
MLLNLLRKKLSFDESSTPPMIDENMSPRSRFETLVRSESLVQRLVCLKELNETVYDLGMQCTVEMVVPAIVKLISDPDMQTRCHVLDSFTSLVSYLLQEDFDTGFLLVSEVFVPAVIRRLWEEKSATVRYHVVSCVSHLCAHLRSSDLGELILVPLVSRLSMEKDDDTRASLTEALGSISTSLGEQLTSQYIVAELCCLAEDSSPHVRRSVVYSIRALSGIGSERLVPVFVGLCGDTDESVREECAEVYGSVVGWLGGVDSSRIFHSLLHDSSLTVRSVANRQLGSVILNSDECMELLIDEYIASKDSVHNSTFCGVFEKLILLDSRMENLEKFNIKFSTLIRSPNPIVAKCIIESLTPGVWEYVQSISPLDGDLILQLFDHEHDSVREAVFRALPVLIQHQSPEQVNAVIQRVLAIVTHSETDPVTTVRNKRFRIAIAETFPDWLTFVPIEFVAQIWTGILIDSYSVIRDHAIRSTEFVLTAQSPSLRSLLGLCHQLCTSLGSSRLASRRQTFLRIIRRIMNSPNLPDWLIDDVFQEKLSRLSTDPVSVVRTTWAKEIVPHLRVSTGRFGRNTQLVIMAHNLLLDPDLEVVRIVAKVPLSPAGGSLVERNIEVNNMWEEITGIR